MRRVVGLALLALLSCGDGGVTRVYPQLAPPASPVDFGAVPVLNEKRVDVPLLNLGRATLTVSNVAVSGDDAFRLVSAPEKIPVGITDVVTVAFLPTEERPFVGTLRFDTDDADNPSLELVLQGEGSTRAAVVVDPPELDFGRVGECAEGTLQLTLSSEGTAPLVVTDIAFGEGTSTAFSFAGSTRTPATVAPGGQLELTVKVAAPAGASGALTGSVRLTTSDPDHQELSLPLSATVNRAPVPRIADFGVAAPGQQVTLDGSASTDDDGDEPLSYRWTLRSKPLASSTAIAAPADAVTEMTLDPAVPGAYEVQLDVTDAEGVAACTPARATVVAAPAQKLLIELFWDNTGTDLDLHVLRSKLAPLFRAPGDCYYQNRTPDWGLPGTDDDPELLRDALTGYGPEQFGYVNPVDGSYRAVVVFNNELLSPAPASKATLRVYVYGVLKAERTRTLQHKDDIWEVLDVAWPSGEVTVLP